jgi:hypothetical protein
MLKAPSPGHVTSHIVPLARIAVRLDRPNILNNDYSTLRSSEKHDGKHITEKVYYRAGLKPHQALPSLLGPYQFFGPAQNGPSANAVPWYIPTGISLRICCARQSDCQHNINTSNCQCRSEHKHSYEQSSMGFESSKSRTYSGCLGLCSCCLRCTTSKQLAEQS